MSVKTPRRKPARHSKPREGQASVPALVASPPVRIPAQPKQVSFTANLALIPIWVAAAVMFARGEAAPFSAESAWITGLVFVVLFLIILWGAFTVVHHAESLAAILGEPLGTLVLTFSVTSIEVALMASIMLHGENNPTLARDAMFAVLMIVMNGAVGMALLAGSLRYDQQEYNLQGARAFLVLIAPLSVFALVLPDYTQATAERTFSTGQALFFALVIGSIYAVFLGVQTMRHRAFFVQPKGATPHSAAIEGLVHRAPAGSGAYHLGLLLLTLVPLVLLAESLAEIADHAIERLGAPPPLGGILIAVLVLAPEAVTAFRAALRDELQRSVNICLGSALATIGLTVPAVLAISLLTAHPVELGLDPPQIVLLVLTLFLGSLTFGGMPTNLLQGLVHLLLFVVYIALIFDR